MPRGSLTVMRLPNLASGWGSTTQEPLRHHRTQRGRGLPRQGGQGGALIQGTSGHPIIAR